MLCQKCNERQATTHIRQTVNGKFYEYDLCDECAASMGYKSIFNTIGINDLFSNLLGEAMLPYQSSVKRKGVPEVRYDVRRICTYRPGGMRRVLRHIQGGAHAVAAEDTWKGAARRKDGVYRVAGGKKEEHCGKTQEGADEAVKEQNFEKAAQLRDQIAELEKED